jgi:predicted SAM-dependent methyltransferase
VLRINVGCGGSPTPGWVNLDNSPSVLLRRLPVGELLNEARRGVWSAARAHGVRYGSALRLPFRDGSADVVYSSHMMEHLSQRNATRFLRECHRILAPGGVLRIVVPNLRVFVDDYVGDGDADRLMNRLMVIDERRRVARLSRFAGHRWMYDERSLTARIAAVGFDDIVVVPSGSTTIGDHGELDLREREEESIYVEARR